MESMTSVDKALAWTGLIFGGGLSIAGNLVSGTIAGLPDDLDADSLDTWRALDGHDMSATSAVTAVSVPLAAILLVEMLKRWTFLPTLVRRGAIGTVAFIAGAASWVHLFVVMLHEGNHPLIAAAVPLIPDTIAIVSAMALLSTPGHVRVDTAPDMDNGADSLPVDSLDMDTWTDPTPDMDTLYVPDNWTTDAPVSPAPVSTPEPDSLDKIPTPRRTAVRTVDASGWRWLANEALALEFTPGQIAARVLEDFPGTWPSLEAGRKAVSRLR